MCIREAAAAHFCSSFDAKGAYTLACKQAHLTS